MMLSFRTFFVKVVLLAFFVVVVSCKPALIIIHTNDTHSHLEPLRGGENDGHGGCIERAAFIDSVRSVHGAENVLLLHAGDFSQGSSYYSQFGGQLEIDIINAMRYDVITLGNHELDNGLDNLGERLKRLQGTKVVCANMDLSGSLVQNYVTECCVVERAGRKIGIIGLEADIYSCVSNDIASNIKMFNNVEVVNKWADHLHNVEKCDLIILLSHIGYELDQVLVPQTHFIDLVIGGHSHTFCTQPLFVKDASHHKVPIISAGKFGIELGLLRL